MDKNLWYFFKLEQRMTQDHGNQELFIDEEAKHFRNDSRDLIGKEVNALVVEMNYGSVVCNDKKRKKNYTV